LCATNIFKCFQLIKVEEGLMTGDVMFHEFIKKEDKKRKPPINEDKEDIKIIETNIKQKTVR